MPALWLERAKHIHHSLLLSYCRDKVVETTWELHTPIVINSWHHLTLRRACIDSEPVMLKTYCGSGQQPERHIPLGSHHSQSNICCFSERGDMHLGWTVVGWVQYKIPASECHMHVPSRLCHDGNEMLLLVFCCTLSKPQYLHVFTIMSTTPLRKRKNLNNFRLLSFLLWPTSHMGCWQWFIQCSSTQSCQIRLGSVKEKYRTSSLDWWQHRLQGHSWCKWKCNVGYI